MASILAGEHDGEHPHGLGGVGGVLGMEGQTEIVVVDLPEHLLAVIVHRSEVVLAMGVVLFGEPPESPDFEQQITNGSRAELADAAGEHHLSSGESLAELVVQGSNGRGLLRHDGISWDEWDKLESKERPQGPL